MRKLLLIAMLLGSVLVSPRQNYSGAAQEKTANRTTVGSVQVVNMTELDSCRISSGQMPSALPRMYPLQNLTSSLVTTLLLAIWRHLPLTMVALSERTLDSFRLP